MVQWSLRSPQMQELVEKLAEWPHGLGFLHLGDVEAVAAVLRVHPFVVVSAREALETEEGRAFLIEALHRARDRRSARPAAAPQAGPAPHERGSARSLIRDARKHALGTSFLLEGHPEAVAVMFHVHPEVVFRVRRLVERFDALRPGAKSSG